LQLGERTYMTNLPGHCPEDPVTFLRIRYDMRGKLVHGEYPRPGRVDVSERASQLERAGGPGHRRGSAARRRGPVDRSGRAEQTGSLDAVRPAGLSASATPRSRDVNARRWGGTG
jgi:hypothetical protein